MRTLGCVGAILALCVAVGIDAQVALTDDAVRPLMIEAVKAAGGDPQKAIASLDRSVKSTFGDFETEPLRLFAGASIAGAVFAPYVNYRIALRNRIRKLDSTDDIRLNDYVEIIIEPSRVDDPDIEKVIVQRDGQAVEPLENTLAAKEFKNRMGASFQLHAGVLHYPVSAFAPGGAVTIVLVPSAGNRNFETKLDAKRLAKLK